MANLRDATEVLRACERQREKMVLNWRENGRFEHCGVSCAALLIVTRGPSGEPLAEPEAVPCDPPAWFVAVCPPERYTEMLANCMRVAGKQWGAIGLVLCSESWMVKMEGPPGKDMTVDEAVRQRAELPCSLEHAPGRMEALTFFLDHVATGTRMWTAEITRNPTKLHPWKQAPADGFAGRFKDVLVTGT